MSWEQLSIFNENDLVCPCCGGIEPNKYLLDINHGYAPGQSRHEHPVFGTKCVTQWLVANHIAYAHEQGNKELLEIEIARGREVGLNIDEILNAGSAVSA